MGIGKFVCFHESWGKDGYKPVYVRDRRCVNKDVRE